MEVPTAVINSSLYGAVKEAGKYSDIDKVYAAIGGSKEFWMKILDLKSIDGERLELLLHSSVRHRYFKV